MKPTLLVLAAGMGSRYGGIKQIDRVGPDGEAIIDYSVYDALQAGFGTVVFVVRREIEQDIRDFFGDRFSRRTNVRYVHQDLTDLPKGVSVTAERQKPWGTAHAVWAARSAIDTPFAVVNADDFYGRASYEVLARELSQRKPDETEYSMVGFRLDRTLSPHGTVSRALCEMTDDAYLKRIEEHTKIGYQGDRIVSHTEDGGELELHGGETVSMNMFGFTPAVFDQIESGLTRFVRERGENPKAEYYIPSLLGEIIPAGEARMRVLPSDERWFGVTYREDKPAVEAALRELADSGHYPRPLWGDS